MSSRKSQKGEDGHIDKQVHSNPIATVSKLGGLSHVIMLLQGDERKKRLDAYYLALGRFVQIFAETEAIVTQTLWAYAGTQRKVSKIIFAGTAADHAANYTRQIALAIGTSAEKKTDLDYALLQFNIIRGVRNDILHYGAEGIEEDRGVVTNEWKAKDVPTVLPIGPADLMLMEGDLRKIIAHLGYRHLGRPYPKSENVKKALDGILQRPWLYRRPPAPKSHAQKESHTQTRKRAPEQQRQRQPSQERRPVAKRPGEK